MQRLLPCAEQVKSPSTLSYCTLSYSTLSYFTLSSCILSSCILSYLIVVILKLRNSELWHPNFLRISFHILSHPFISCHIILVKNLCISYHFISFLAALLDLIWGSDPCADERYCSTLVRLAALELYHLHLGSVWWMSLDTLPARKFLKEGGFPRYVCKYFYIYTCSICMSYIIYVDPIPFCGDSTGRTWNSHINRDLSGTSHISGCFAWALIPEEIVVVWVANSLICFKNFCINKIKFLMSIHNLGFRILGFYHRVQWSGARTAGKKCWGPCHGLIPSLWDFAQNCSLQIERWNQNWRGTSDSLDSEEAVEPCISTVADRPWIRQLRQPFIPLVPNDRRRLNIKCHVSTYCNFWSQQTDVPTRGKIAVKDSCAEERQAFWNSHDGLNLTCLDPPKAGAKELSYNCLNLIHDTSLFSSKVIVAGLPRKAFRWK